MLRHSECVYGDLHEKNTPTGLFISYHKAKCYAKSPFFDFVDFAVMKLLSSDVKAWDLEKTLSYPRAKTSLSFDKDF